MIAYYCIDSPATGRKWSLFVSYSLTTLFSLITFFTQGWWFMVWISGIKLFASLAFIIIYQFTAELYPTLIRATSSALMNFVCRLGGIMMPWIIKFMFLFGTFAPFLSIAAISSVSAFANYLLPIDTTGMRLDQYEVLKEPEDI